MLGILNVGAGDNKLVLDKDDPASLVRAARIIRDMLRRGYTLLAEVPQRDGSKKFQRVYDFKENTFEYVIADLDPDGPVIGAAPRQEETAASAQPTPSPGRRGRRTKSIDATTTRAHAIAHTAGG